MPGPCPVEVEPSRLPRLKRLVARLRPVRVAVDSEHFKAPTEIFLAYCRRHRVYFLDYPHGFDGYLNCPRCLEEFKRRAGGG